MRIISVLFWAVYLLVTGVRIPIVSYTGSNMASWFEDLPEFKMDTPGVWGQDALAWDYKKLWADKETLKTYMEKFWKDLSAGAVKGKTNPITWFVSDSDDFLNMISNEYFFQYTAEEQKEVIHNLNKRFVTARDNYYNDDGKVPVTPQGAKKKKNHNAKAVATVFPFGPWVYWTKTDWEELEYKYDSARRKERLQDAMSRVKHASSSSTSTSTEKTQPVVSYSQSKRGRKDKVKDKNRHRDRSRSRQRDRAKRAFSDDEKSGINSDDPAV